MTKTSGFDSISTKLERIAKQAREAPGMVFTTLAHPIDIALARRSQRPLWWHQFKRLLDRFPIPYPRELIPPWPDSANL